MNDEILLTPASLLDFLCQIDELADYGISVEDAGGSITVKIGQSVYTIDKADAQLVEVPDEVVEEVSDINELTYEELQDVEYEQTLDIPDDSPIEAGIISELLKTLAVGGMVRLTGKVLGDDFKK